MKKILKNEKGQAVFEFLIFLPFYLAMYTVAISIASSINGSINQQKLVRGYFFARIKNSSMLPTVGQLESAGGATSVGLVSIGWRREAVGGGDNGEPLAACYKIQSLAKGSASDDCDSKPSKTTSQFIKVKTMFGMCGTTYRKTGNFFEQIMTSSQGSCTNQ